MSRDLRARQLVSAALLSVTALVAMVVAPHAVGAQEPDPPTASAEAACIDGEGAIVVVISDEISTTFNVFIDDELVDEDVFGSGDEGYAYGPFDDGTYNVVVVWFDEEEVILDVDVTVACTEEPTTTTTTTSVPPAPASTVAPAPAAAPAALSLTG
jgi:hypothetical protein